MLSEPLMISSSQRSTGTVYGAGSSFFRSSSPFGALRSHSRPRASILSWNAAITLVLYWLPRQMMSSFTMA